MSKESSIKVFAENVSGTRPANAIPVWIDNISAIGGGGGGGSGGDEEVNTLVHSNSATWNTVSGKADTSALTAYARSYIVDELADDVLNKLDTTAFSTVSGTFLTAHQSLDGYATESLVQDTSANITATIPSTAGLASESYVQTNSAVLTGMIDGKQDALTFGYDEQDRINSINSSALAGGGGTTYTSPSGTILIEGNTLETTNSAVRNSDVFISAITFEYQTPIPESNDIDYYEFNLPAGKIVDLGYRYWSEYNQTYTTITQRAENYSEDDIIVRYPYWSADFYGDNSMSGNLNMITAVPPNNVTALSAFDTVSNVVELVSKSDFDNLYSAFTAYTASHP